MWIRINFPSIFWALSAKITHVFSVLVVNFISASFSFPVIFVSPDFLSFWPSLCAKKNKTSVHKLNLNYDRRQTKNAKMESTPSTNWCTRAPPYNNLLNNLSNDLINESIDESIDELIDKLIIVSATFSLTRSTVLIVKRIILLVA